VTIGFGDVAGLFLFFGGFVNIELAELPVDGVHQKQGKSSVVVMERN